MSETQSTNTPASSETGFLNPIGPRSVYDEAKRFD
jgi:hypothetical protein